MMGKKTGALVLACLVAAMGLVGPAGASTVTLEAGVGEPSVANQSANVTVVAGQEGGHVSVVLEGAVDERVEEQVPPGDPEDAGQGAYEGLVATHDAVIGACNEAVGQLGGFQCARLI